MANIYDGNGNVISVANGTLTEFDLAIIPWSLPVLYITSDVEFANLTKETASDATVKYIDGKKKFELSAKIKLQGRASLQYAKKNLNITFYNDKGKKQKLIFKEWYPTNKIHLKANEYDYSMVRNSVGTKLAYELCGRMLPNGARGYIDSFPAIMYYNNVYMGCFTVNLPQDGKTYNFSDSKEEAGQNLAYRTTGSADSWRNSNYWEYRGDADETAEMRSVFDATVITALNNSNLTRADVEAVFDVNTLLSYLAFAQISCAVDSLVNNWTLVTWDGIKWYHTWYDLDICFGLGGGQDGANISATKDVFESAQGKMNTFFQQVETLYDLELRSTYANMRKHGADIDHIVSALFDFQSAWGWENITADRTKWESDKQNMVDITSVRTWLTDRFEYLDNMYGYME